MVLLSHVHADHLGDRIQPHADAGTCAEPEFSVDVTPQSNTIDVVVEQQARLVVGGEMPAFFNRKVEAAGGASDQVELLRFGASTRIGGVEIASVPAVHSNGLSPMFMGTEYARMLSELGLTAYVGPPGGYVLRFSNGLAVYLSGDTGVTAEQQSVVRGLYGAQLAVINIGDVFTTGPREAAHVINELVRPAAVIASHANEVATREGQLLPDTRTARFVDMTDVPVHLPLSGRSMRFDGQGRCLDGCDHD